MPLALIAIVVIALLFGLSAVYGLVWAIRTGQFSNFGRGAMSIFDEDEPVGETTDVFPGRRELDRPNGEQSAPSATAEADDTADDTPEQPRR